MTGPNSVNSWEDWAVEKKQKDEKDVYNELIHWFWKTYLSTLDDTEKNSLTRDIMTGTVIAGTDIETHLKKYIASNPEYTGLDISKINIYQLRNKLAGAFASRKNNEELIKWAILWDFEISPDEYNTKVKSKVEWLSDTQINILLKSDWKQKELLDQNLWREVLPKNQVSILETISESESAKRLNRMSQEDRVTVLAIFEKAKYQKVLNDIDIQILIDTKYFWDWEIKELVRNFIPHISLQKAIDLWFINLAAAETVRNTYIDTYASENGITLDATTKTEIQKWLDLTDALISTDDLSISAWDHKKLAKDVWFHNFERDLRENKEKIQEELRKNGPASFTLMKEAISSLWKANLIGFEKLHEWSVLEFNTTKDGEETKQYTKIVWVDDTTKSFSFRNIGTDAVNLTAKSETQRMDYVNFVENLRSSSSKIHVYTQSDLDTSIKSWSIKTASLQSFSDNDFSGAENKQKRDVIRWKQIEQVQDEIEGLKQELELQPSSNLTKARLWEKEKQLMDLQLWSDISAEYAAEKATFFELLDKLNEADPDGKSIWFEKWIFIETENNAFRIDGLDIENEKVVLNGLKSNSEPLDFSDFLKAFKSQKAKRYLWLDSVESFVKRISEQDGWNKIESGSKWLVEKDIDYKWQKDKQPIEYLTSKESDVLVKVVSIWNGQVEIQRWEQEDTKEKKWKDEEEVKKLKIKWAEVESYTLNEFARFIESEKLIPDWKLGKNWLEVEPDDPHNERNNGATFWGTMWKIFINGRMSFAELAAWWKMIPELVEEYWKKGSDIKSAKAALAMWKFLPKQMRDELLVKIEKAEWESMEKALEDLWKIDSPEAVGRIKGWLLDKNTPEYNKEAWLLWMLQKYGHLTSKWPMYPFRWKFLWYEAFGGRKNDALYLEIKQELEDDGQNFSEEFLMWMLLKRQCKTGGYNGIKRRWRLHKEFEWKFKAWMEEEFEKWYKDASTKRTASKMVKEWMGEALWGTTTNALWWMKKAVERWWSLEDMMEISFSLLFSWAVFDMDQASYLKAKWLWDGEWQPIISQRMMSSKDEMNLFNRTVLALSQQIWEAYPNKYSGISKRAQDIFDESKARSKSEKERLEAAQEFWHDYGKPLSRALNISMQPDGDTSITDTIIKRKQDIPPFKEYYEKVKWYVEETDNVFKENFVEDAIWDTGVFGLNTYKISKKFLEISQWGTFKKWTAGERVWKRMREDINSTPSKILEANAELNSVENRAAQKSYLAVQLKEISAWLLAAHGWNQTALWALNNNTSLIWSELNKWGINMKSDLWEFSAEAIKNWDKNNFFYSVAEKIISGWTSEEYTWETPVELQVNKTKDSTAQTTSGQSSLNDYYWADWD